MSELERLRETQLTLIEDLENEQLENERLRKENRRLQTIIDGTQTPILRLEIDRAIRQPWRQ